MHWNFLVTPLHSGVLAFSSFWETDSSFTMFHRANFDRTFTIVLLHQNRDTVHWNFLVTPLHSGVLEFSKFGKQILVSPCSTEPILTGLSPLFSYIKIRILCTGISWWRPFIVEFWNFQVFGKLILISPCSTEPILTGLSPLFSYICLLYTSDAADE